MPAIWAISDLADTIADGLSREARRFDEEQAVYGLDALGELQLHPFLVEALKQAGYGVHREQRYPGDRIKTRESEGERCDLVLTIEGRPLATPGKAPTLFDPADAVDLDDAYWMEVKVVSQFCSEGANRTYASQLLSTVRQDVVKLSKDPGILHAGLLNILFAQDQRVAQHDLDIWVERCIGRGLPIAAPSVRMFPIVDRMGNGVCAIAVCPISHL